MTVQTIEAVFERGFFRILSPRPLGLDEGQHVQLFLEPLVESKDVLDLFAQVYDGLSEKEIEAIEAQIKRREDFFDEEPAA